MYELPPFPLRINLAGRFASGKGFIARLLAERYGYHEISYSDPLYLALAEELGVPVQTIYDDKATYRSRLQNMGHGRRQENPKYWIEQREKLVRRYREEQQHSPLFQTALAPVIEAGTRYENEARDAMERGGLVIRVVASKEVRWQRYFDKYGKFPTEEQENHITEVQTDTLPVHLEISGELPAHRILPVLTAAAQKLYSGLQV